MELDFVKICRVCLNEGPMMSIFKVNVSRKLMVCASVQVWQNDNLPSQICKKCLARLHICYQFKRQCEKNDSKLRQELVTKRQNDIEAQENEMKAMPPPLQVPSILQPSHPQQNGCVFIECAPIPEVHHMEAQKFDNFLPVSQQDPLTQLNYNIQVQSDPLQLGGYNIQNVGGGQVQIYNGTYSMPLQTMQPSILHNQLMTPQMSLNHQPLNHNSVSSLIQQPQHNNNQSLPLVKTGEEDVKDKKKFGNRLKNDGKNEDNTRQCPTCNKIFATAAKLTRHLKTHTNATDMPHKCNICNKAFSHGGNYKIHLRMHSDERPFRCSVCNKGCRQAQDLEKHMRTHTGERPHKCPMCPRAFSTSSNLIAHIRTHTGERPYVCCVCQKAFCQSNELTKHMRTHTGEKSHICDICNKGFNGSSTLIVHRRSHTGEKPYVCRVCNRGFAQSSCLAVHMKRHNTVDKSHLCATCDITFRTDVELKDHATTAHPVDEKTFECDFCDRRYARGSDLTRHMQVHSFKAEEIGDEDEEEGLVDET